MQTQNPGLATINCSWSKEKPALLPCTPLRKTDLRRGDDGSVARTVIYQLPLFLIPGLMLKRSYLLLFALLAIISIVINVLLYEGVLIDTERLGDECCSVWLSPLLALLTTAVFSCGCLHIFRPQTTDISKH